MFQHKLIQKQPTKKKTKITHDEGEQKKNRKISTFDGNGQYMLYFLLEAKGHQN